MNGFTGHSLRKNHFPHHRSSFALGGWTILALALTLSNFAFSSPLTHRYSFDSDATDSIGAADGVLLGSAMVTNGAVILDGSSGAVQLPANLFTNSDSLTLEIWFSNTSTRPTQYLWYFGGSPPITFLLQTGPPFFREAGGSYGGQLVACPQISTTWPHHLVWTQDAASHTARVYLDGSLLAKNSDFTEMPGTTATGFVGGINSSAPINGSISEFRIYSNAIPHLEVLKSDAMGPDQLPPEGEALIALHLAPPSTVGLDSWTTPSVYADFTTQKQVDITSLPDILFTSDDTNVIAISSDRQLEAVHLGTAEIQASYGGISATATVTVAGPVHYALAHRYDFNGAASDAMALDTVGGAHGWLRGRDRYTGDGQLSFGGTGCYVDLPDRVLSSLDEVTVEAWITASSGLSSSFYPRIFDFGSQQANGFGGSYFFLTPAGAGYVKFAATTNGLGYESPILTFPFEMPAGQEFHFAVTYSPQQNQSKLYTNGVLAASAGALTPLGLIVDTNNWLGRSQYTQDAYFTGTFNEFRMYRTALNDSEIAADYAAGPDVIGVDFLLRPELRDSNLLLAWGPSADALQLQSSSSPGPDAVWTNTQAAPVFTNGQYEAVVPLSDNPQFFRLAPP